MSRLSYKTLFIILLFLLIPIVFLLRINQKSKNVSAAWWNDSWMYRQSINISSHTSSESNVYLTTTINIGDTSKAQADDGDFRFTSATGNLYPYYIVSGAGTTAITFHIQLDSFPNGAQTIYAYYGNPSAPNGFSSSDFTTAATNYTTGSLGSEEIGGGPIAHWKFDEGIGTTLYNSSSNQNNGYFGSTAPTWANESQCINGKCLSFDGTQSAYSNYDLSWNNTNNVSLSFWVKPQNTTDSNKGILGKQYSLYEWSIYQSGSSVSLVYWNTSGGHTNGMDDSWGNVLTANRWTHLAYTWDGSTSRFFANGKIVKTKIATNPSINMNRTNNMMFGGNIYTWGNTYFKGLIDEVKIYNYVRTAEQIKQDYTNHGSNVNIGGTSIQTTPGNLVAYYKFDEGHGSVVNNSGIGGSSANGTLASGTSSPVWVNDGKINKSLNFNNNNYINLPNTLGYTNTVSAFAWFKSNGTPTGNYHIIMGGQELEISIPVSGQIRTGVFTNTRYVSNHGSGLLDNQWHHVGFTFDGSTKKSYIDGQFVGQQTGIGGTLRSSFTGRTIGKFGTSNVYFLNGYLDEVKIFDYPLSEDEIKREYNQSASIIFSVDKVNVGNTSVSALYCVPGSTDPCSPPVAEWKFDEEVGTTAYDTSGNNINLRTYNATPTVGKIGRALNFNSSSNSYLISSSDPGVMSSGTYSLWVKPSTINANMGWIDSNFDIFQWTGNSLYFRAGNQSSVSISNWSTDTWHHLSLTWNGSNYYGYIDGKEVTSGVQSGSRSGLINLGRVDNNYYFDGSIDQIRIYNYARTPAQIAWDYNQGAPVAHYKLDECQGTTIHDSSDNANHGTLSIGASGTQNTLGTCTVGTSAAWTNGATGKINSSLSFDGTDDYAYINQVNLSNTDKMSLSFWLKFSGNSLKIISEYSNNFNSNNSFLIDHSEFGIPGSLQISDHTPSGYNISYTSKAYNDNQWHHFVSTIDRSLGINQNKIYIDGKEDNILHTSHRTDLSGNFGGPFTLYLSSRAGNSYFFPGLIDDVRIYNYALTPDQIKQIYNSGAINFN